MKSGTAYQLKIGSTSAFCVLTLASTLYLAIAATLVAYPLPFLAVFGVGAEARADMAARNGSRTSEVLRLNRASLNASPMNAAAWLRIAFLSTRDSGHFDAESREAVEDSYSVSPLGPEVSAWRIHYLYEHWDEISSTLRAEALGEHAVQPWRPDFNPDTVLNPSGRLAAQMNQVRARAISEERRKQLEMEINKQSTAQSQSEQP